jgi:hypothetical protein
MSLPATETILAIGVGIGLSAACGFRVFLPLLALSIGARWGGIPLASGFEWIETWPALVVLATATGLEIAAYYIPFVDHLLDGIAAPAAVIAGTLVMASTLTNCAPLYQWSFALIAGGGIAGAIQGGTMLLRGASSVATVGLGNFLIATLEWIGALLLSLAAVLFPMLLLGGLFLISVIFLWRRLQSRKSLG